MKYLIIGWNMEKDKAVRQMMTLNIKSNPLIPEDCYSAIANALEMMYMVGWEERVKDNGNFQRKRVIQMDGEGNYLHTYLSVNAAGKATKCSPTTITKAVQEKWKTHKGQFTWKFPTPIVKDNTDILELHS